MIAVIDYDAGNIRSVEKALHYLGEEPEVTRDKKAILKSDGVILPGVGAFGDAMEKLHSYGLTDTIRRCASEGIPFLGICLGMQIGVIEFARNVLQYADANSREFDEMEKILENTYRNINIGLINEMAMLCDRMKINIWEVIDAARTKPYGFQAFYPGPGLGGHCIPLDPYYLSWKVREYAFHTSMIETSMMINDRMPEYCVQRAAGILNEFSKSLKGSRVLVLGVAYKADIDDCRESPAFRVINVLRKKGAEVQFFDPYVRKYTDKEGIAYSGEPSLTQELLENADLVIITTAHSCVDYEFVQKHSKAVFDTRNAMKNVKCRSNIELL